MVGMDHHRYASFVEDEGPRLFNAISAQAAQPLCDDLLRVLGPTPVGNERWSYLWVDLCRSEDDHVRQAGILLVSALSKVAPVAGPDVRSRLESSITEWGAG